MVLMVVMEEYRAGVFGQEIDLGRAATSTS
jgi:hypothetical protein